VIVSVECYSGSAYAERPTAFIWEGIRLEIGAILNRWRTPVGNVFRVQTIDGLEFELAYDEGVDRWTAEAA
jgi:hypothetical protein